MYPARHYTYVRAHLTVVIVVAIAVLIGLHLRQRWTTVTTVSFQTLARDSISTNTKVLVMGSSHVYRGIDYRCFEQPCVSLNNAGCDYTMMLALWKKHSTNLPNVRNVLIEFDPTPMFYDVVAEFPTNATLPHLGLAPYEYPRPLLSRLVYSSVSNVWIQNSPTPKNIYRWLRKRNDPTPHLVAGFRPTDEITKDAGLKHAIKISEMFARNSSWNAYKHNMVALETLVGLLQERDIRVFLVQFPKLPTFWEQLSPKYIQQFEENKKLFRGDPRVSFIDCDRSGGLLTFETADFLDSDHLNTSGAARLSSYLNSLIHEE